MANGTIPTPEQQRTEIMRLLHLAADESIGDFYGGKRRHLRFRLFRPFDAEPVDAEDIETLAAHLQDISASGVSFWCKTDIAECTPMRIREYDREDNDAAGWVSVRVTHSTPGIRGYLIGAAFDYPVPEDTIQPTQVAEDTSEEEMAPAKKPGLFHRLAAALTGAHA